MSLDIIPKYKPCFKMERILFTDQIGSCIRLSYSHPIVIEFVMKLELPDQPYKMSTLRDYKRKLISAYITEGLILIDGFWRIHEKQNR